VDGEQFPVFVWTIDHPAGRVLVDTGMIDARPEADDLSPTPHPENIPRDVAAATASSRACRSASGTRARRRAFAGRLHDPRMGRLRRRDLCRARGRGGAATGRSSPSSSGSRTSRSLAAAHHVSSAAVHMARGDLQAGRPLETQRSGRRIASRNGRATKSSLRRTRFARGVCVAVSERPVARAAIGRAGRRSRKGPEVKDARTRAWAVGRAGRNQAPRQTPSPANPNARRLQVPRRTRRARKGQAREAADGSSRLLCGGPVSWRRVKAAR
jgi:hypothetical protein